MLNFERIFRHDCRILATKILVSDFYPLYGEASTQVSMTCTRLCMFPQLVGEILRHEWQRRSMLRCFFRFFGKIRKTHGAHF